MYEVLCIDFRFKKMYVINLGIQSTTIVEEILYEFDEEEVIYGYSLKCCYLTNDTCKEVEKNKSSNYVFFRFRKMPTDKINSYLGSIQN
jgi:hypothetical protein